MFARLVLTLVDKDGETAPCAVSVAIDGSTSLDDAVNLYLRPLFDGITNFMTGAVLDATITISPNLSTWPGSIAQGTNPGTLSDVQEKVVITLRPTVGRDFRFTIPTIEESYFVESGAGKSLDITQVDVLALYTLLTEDITNNGIDAVDSHGFDVTRVVSSHQAFVGRKGD